MIPFPILSSTNIVPKPTIIKLVTTGQAWFCTTFILYDNGEVWAVGYNSQWWGVNITGTQNEWVLIISNAKDIWASSNGTVIKTQDNKVLFSGDIAMLGLTGTNKNIWFDISTQVLSKIPNILDIVDVGMSSGMSFLSNSGELWFCGSNAYGAVGNIGSLINYNSMIRIGTRAVKFLQTDIYGSMYLTTSNEVYMCGENRQGRFGNGGTSNYSNYTRVIASGALDIGMTFSNTILKSSVLTPIIKLWSAGQQSAGQLGNAQTAVASITSRVASTIEFDMDGLEIIKTAYSNATSGEPISCTIKQGNNLYRAGRNNYGQFGDGTPVGTIYSEFQLLPVIGTGDINYVASSDYTTFYIRSGELYGAGSFYGFPRSQTGTNNVMSFIKVQTPY